MGNAADKGSPEDDRTLEREFSRTVQEDGARSREMEVEENSAGIQVGGMRGRGVNRGALRGVIISRMGAIGRGLGRGLVRGPTIQQEDLEDTGAAAIGNSVAGLHEEVIGAGQLEDTREGQQIQDTREELRTEQVGSVTENVGEAAGLDEAAAGNNTGEGLELESIREESPRVSIRQELRPGRRVAALLKFAIPEEKKR